MSHGGRVMFQLAKSKTKDTDHDFWRWLITGKENGMLSSLVSTSTNSDTCLQEKKIVFKRIGATHSIQYYKPKKGGEEVDEDGFFFHLPYGRKKYITEVKTMGISLRDTKILRSEDQILYHHRHWAHNLPLWGYKQESFSGNLIAPNGEHGHLYIYYQSSKDNRNGGIMVCSKLSSLICVCCDTQLLTDWLTARIDWSRGKWVGKIWSVLFVPQYYRFVCFFFAFFCSVAQRRWTLAESSAYSPTLGYKWHNKKHPDRSLNKYCNGPRKYDSMFVDLSNYSIKLLKELVKHWDDDMLGMPALSGNPNDIPIPRSITGRKDDGSQPLLLQEQLEFPDLRRNVGRRFQRSNARCISREGNPNSLPEKSPLSSSISSFNSPVLHEIYFSSPEHNPLLFKQEPVTCQETIPQELEVTTPTHPVEGCVPTFNNQIQQPLPQYRVEQSIPQELVSHPSSNSTSSLRYTTSFDALPSSLQHFSELTSMRDKLAKRKSAGKLSGIDKKEDAPEWLTMRKPSEIKKWRQSQILQLSVNPLSSSVRVEDSPSVQAAKHSVRRQYKPLPTLPSRSTSKQPQQEKEKPGTNGVVETSLPQVPMRNDDSAEQTNCEPPFPWCVVLYYDLFLNCSNGECPCGQILSQCS